MHHIDDVLREAAPLPGAEIGEPSDGDRAPAPDGHRAPAPDGDRAPAPDVSPDEAPGDTPAKQPAGRAARNRTVPRPLLMIVAMALFCVLVPIHVFGYGTAVTLALPLGASICVAPLVASPRPRTAIVLFCLAAFILPLAADPDRIPSWPWPWSVPAMIAFVVFLLVITTVHGWRTGVVPLAVSNVGSLLSAPLLMSSSQAGAVGVDLIVTASITAAAFLVAMLLASRLRVGEELNREREHTASEQARRILVEERTRIARELHDVVAHSTSLIQVQASTARYRVPDLPAEATAEFDDIAESARGSLTEMRRLLGVLRTEDHAPPLAPQQGIAEIPVLVDGFRRAGADIAFSLSAPPADLSASVQLDSYRIAQEALSNAVRHAPGAAIELVVDARDGAVSIRAHNEADSDSPPTTEPGTGNGLRGMRERVSRLAGRLEAGPDPAGGWTVTAVLPWSDASQERP